MNKSRINAVLTLAAVAMATLVFSVPASADLLVHEPFAYTDPNLTGQGGALGTTGVWTSNDWSVHQQGVLSGAVLHTSDLAYGPVTFDGTFAGLATSGGYTGQDASGGQIRADIALDPAVTASFTSDSTTWLSYVSVVNFTRNYELPNLTLGTIAHPTSRGDNYGGIGTGGDGIGTGGGPNRDNRNEIYPMFYTTGQYNNVQGAIPGNSYVSSADTFVDANGSFNAQFNVANLVVVKLEWDAGANGEDIISLGRFLEGEMISEAEFNAQMIAMPDLTSANWDVANQPSLDQSQFGTISFAGIKYFVDEIRLGTTFEDVTPVPEPATMSLLVLGGLGLLRRRRKS